MVYASICLFWDYMEISPYKNTYLKAWGRFKMKLNRLKFQCIWTSQLLRYRSLRKKIQDYKYKTARTLPRTLKGGHKNEEFYKKWGVYHLCFISFTVNPPIITTKMAFSITHTLRNINKLKGPTCINFITKWFTVKQHFRITRPERHNHKEFYANGSPGAHPSKRMFLPGVAQYGSPKVQPGCTPQNTASTETLKLFCTCHLESPVTTSLLKV